MAPTFAFPFRCPFYPEVIKCLLPLYSAPMHLPEHAPDATLNNPLRTSALVSKAAPSATVNATLATQPKRKSVCVANENTREN